MIILKDISLFLGGKTLFEDANATILSKQKVGIIGNNGCGKSTLLSMIKGQHAQDKGQLSLSGQMVISSVSQELPDTNISAIDYVLSGDEELESLNAQLEKAEQEHNGHLISELHQKLSDINGYSAQSRAGSLLYGLGFKTTEHTQAVNSFSGGWRMRLNLARALMCRSDILMLDEPTNHLDLEAILWLEQWLKSYSGILLLISHDRDFLDKTVNQIVHIYQNKFNQYSGHYSDFEKQRAERMALQQAMFVKQQNQIAHMQSFITRFKAKATKAKQAQSRVKALEKMQIIAPAHIDSPFQFSFSQPPHSPSPLLVLENVSFGFENNTIFENIDFTLLKGQRICLLGPNGAGKSTFLKLLCKDIIPHQGTVTLGKGLKIGYFAQHQLEYLRGDQSLYWHIQELSKEASEQQIRDYLGGFNFRGDDAFKPVSALSGGEKARLALALIVWQKPNLLLLDEPTNHLDLEVRHALSLALAEFEGSLIVISHDRHLLRTICDEIMVINQGQVKPFDGDLDEYYQWLNNQAVNEENNAPVSSSDNSPSKKELRQKAADKRAALRPITQAISKCEKQMEQTENKLTDVREQLADPQIYDELQKDNLAKLLKQEGELSLAHDDLEEKWMALQEDLEQKEQAWE